MTVTKSDYKETENHLYETDYWGTLALLRRISFHGLHIWEPAAGNHKMADILRVCSRAASVTTSDIVDYKRRHDFIWDFTLPTNNPFEPNGEPFGAIVTNPPFGNGNRLAAKFCRLALQRCNGIVAMLCTAKFDFGNTRTDLFRDNPRFHCKISLIDRIRWFDHDGSEDGTEDHAWYVWRPVDVPYTPPVIYYEGKLAA